MNAICSYLHQLFLEFSAHSSFLSRKRLREEIPGQESALESRGDNLTMSQLGKAPAQVPEYQYKALPDGQSIRMLTLSPGALDDLLEGKLDLVNIASPGNYEPLSYVWGEPDRRASGLQVATWRCAGTTPGCWRCRSRRSRKASCAMRICRSVNYSMCCLT